MPSTAPPIAHPPRALDRRSLLAPLSQATTARPLRRLDGPTGPPPETTEALPALAVIALTRLGFGPRPGEIAAFEALPGDEMARLTAWVDQQLNPAAIPDAACDAKLAAAGFTTLSKSRTQLFADHHVVDPPWEVRIRPVFETLCATWIRAQWSKRQLFELLVDFWHNHFNVYGWEYLEAPMWVSYDRDVIRAHALGNFRQMLEAMCKSVPMLVYLDNFTNFADTLPGDIPVGSNENFARELIELHTMGSLVSYGNVPRNQVPGYPNPVGYCQADVVDVARALTGWTFAIEWIEWACPDASVNDGRFIACNHQHDTRAKEVLGQAFPAGRSAAVDGAAVLDKLAAHPATGRYLATKLVRRLVADEPPAALVDSAAALFTAQWQAPDQIKQVVRHIALSTEFRATWGTKAKRPFEIAASAVRAAGGNAPFTMAGTGPDKEMMDGFLWLYGAGGQGLFEHHPPDGYPDRRSAWQSANPRVALWRLVNWLVESNDLDQDRMMDIVAPTVASTARSANELVDFWIARLLGRPLDAAARAELVEFMAQGRNPDFDLPITTNEWPEYVKDRLRSLVALILMSPEFLVR